MAKVMIESAINGVAMKEANPHIGYTPEEIANDAIATCKAGAAPSTPGMRRTVSTIGW